MHIVEFRVTLHFVLTKTGWRCGERVQIDLKITVLEGILFGARRIHLGFRVLLSKG